MPSGKYRAFNNKAYHSIGIGRKNSTGSVLLFTLLWVVLAACNPLPGSQPASPADPASPVGPVSGTGFPQAVVVYAQPNFTTSMLYSTGQNTLKNAGYIAADQSGGFYVADYGNSRVLHFPASVGMGVGPQADQVYGQPDYVSNGVHKGPAGLNYPHGVAVDSNGGLYISDMFNNRVLHYPPGSTSADRVYGQINFTTSASNSGGLSAGSLSQPQGLAIDSTGLYVADSANNRVLHFPVGSTTADFVYGQGTPGNSQANFTSNVSDNGAIGLNNPRDVAINSTGLYIADSGNHRVLHYTVGNVIADRVYGQLDFSSTATSANQGLGNPTATTLNNPTQLALDQNGGLYVSDRNNNRIVYYPSATQSGLEGNDPMAVRVYGQKGFTGNDASTTANTFHTPGGVTIDTKGNIFVLDISNQRVLKFVTRWKVISQLPVSIPKGKTFQIKVALEDAGSGMVFTDYSGPVTVRIHSGTGPSGAVLSGATTVQAEGGRATFKALAINLPGVGYMLASSSPGYAVGATQPFSIK